MVLLLVLVVLTMLTLIGFSFELVMRTEYRAAVVQGRQLRAEALAESGFARALALLMDPEIEPDQRWDNAEQLHAVIVEDGELTGWVGRFSIVADDPDNNEEPRFGVTSEAAKVNILTADRDTLLGLPGVTEEMADSLLDWRDSDSNSMPSGAETEEYLSTYGADYGAKDGPFESVEELLKVRGWTARILFGEDTNRNGVLDPNENDGDVTPPTDDGNDVLDVGLAPLLTLYSAEPNVDSEGKARINLNDGNVNSVKQKVQQAFSRQHADFVEAYRKELAKGSSSGNSGSDNDLDQDGAPTPDSSNGPIQSVSELIGAKATVETRVRGRTRRVTVNSPFTVRELDKMLDRLTTSADKTLIGRIDVMQAPATVLEALPGLEESSATVIQARTDLDADLSRTPAWLVSQGVLSLQQFKRIESTVTTRSAQWSIESVGYYDAGGLACRVRAIFDLSGPKPKCLFWQNLSRLGNAYDLRQIESTELD